MKIKDVSVLVPQYDMVLVKMINLESIEDSIQEMRTSNAHEIATRYGEVVSMGRNAKLPEHCSSLNIGDIAVFTEFAGYFVATEDDLYKLIRAYDIVGIMSKDMELERVEPTANRIMVEELDSNIQEDGLLLSTSDKDPRLMDLVYGKVIKLGPDIKNNDIAEGSVVAYAPYVGTLIRHMTSTDSPALKIIVEEDILLKI